MKNLMILLVSALVLTGCSLKKNSNAEPPVENDDTALEELLIEYNASEFRRIDIPLVFEDNTATMEFEELDLTSLGIEGSRSPCLDDEEYLEEWKNNNYYIRPLFDDEEELERNYKGYIRYVKLIGGKVIFFVDHDTWCECSHDFAAYSYDIDSEELKQLYYYRGMEPPFDPDDAAVAENGDIYYSDDNSKTINRLDAVTGETSVVMMSDRPEIHIEANGETIVSRYEGKGGFVSSQPETGQPIALVYDHQNDSYETYLLDGDKFQFLEPEYRIESTEGDEGRCDVVTDKVRLHTGFSKAFVEGVTDSRITVRWESGKLFTFDFDKMELYVTEGRKLYSIFPDGNGNFYTGGGNDHPNALHLFVPELGTAFRISDEDVSFVSCGTYNGHPVFYKDPSSNSSKLMIMKEKQ